MIRTIASLSLIAGLVVISGCKDNEYESPTKKNPLTPMPAATKEDLQAFVTTSNKYALKLAETETFSRSDKDIVLCPPSILTGLLPLLDASTGDTYTDIAHSIGATSPDNTIYFRGGNKWLTSVETEEHRHIRNGLFMIWPIKLEDPFVDRIATTFGNDIQRFGAASLATQNGLDVWLKNATGVEGLRLNDKLNKDRDIMLAFDTARFSLKDAGKPATVSQAGNWTMTTYLLDPEPYELLEFHPLDSGVATTGFPDFKTLAALAKATPEPTTEKPPGGLAGHYTADLGQIYKETGLGRILTGPLDLRGIGLEINGPYNIAQNAAFVRLDFDSQAAPPTADVNFMVLDRTSGIIVLIGKKKGSAPKS